MMNKGPSERLQEIQAFLGSANMIHTLWLYDIGSCKSWEGLF